MPSSVQHPLFARFFHLMSGPMEREVAPHRRELLAGLRGKALEAAATAKLRVTVVDGLADALPFESASFDAAVASLVLCSVPDPRSALGEPRRAPPPGGE